MVTNKSEENGERVWDGKGNDDGNDIASDLTSNEVFFYVVIEDVTLYFS